ncbi:predicted protein [Arabidopsis lyrata subsp. lyrata]|uniref:Predicted protein n=1 Tax=Arabidopsis lyrata subsp. lyrata TaxID=81972 RepID=D7MXS3_ARALL|nr:predicted protein [Arabidopsis lyrata subsp. lyrata]
MTIGFGDSRRRRTELANVYGLEKAMELKQQRQKGNEQGRNQKRKEAARGQGGSRQHHLHITTTRTCSGHRRWFTWLGKAFIHIWGICDDVSSIETLQNNFPSGTGEWLSSECDEPECSSEERGSQADTQIHATGLRDVSPPRGEGVVMANFNTNHTVVPLVASMLCLLDIPAHTFVWDVALVVDNTDPNGNRSNEM